MNTYTYELRVDDKLKRPVVAYIKTHGVTAMIIRGHNIEDVEAEAKRWIDERTASGVGVVR